MKKISLLTIFLLVIISISRNPIQAKPIIKERKWVLSGVGRSLFLVKLDGSDRENIFDGVADKDSRIEVLCNSYHGKIILCKVVSKALFSYWLVDLDKNEQFPIIQGLRFRPSNSMLSKDGSKACFTTIEKDKETIWIFDYPTKKLIPFGENISDGIVKQVRFSTDGQYALYIKLMRTNRNNYRVLCLRDFNKNVDMQLTTEKDGDIDLGEFCSDSQNIYITRYFEDNNNNSLWNFNIKTKKFSFIMEIPDENISALSISSDNNNIAICTYDPYKPGKLFFWSYQKNKPNSLSYINSLETGMIGLRISADGTFILYSTENSPTYLSNFEGTFNEILSDLVMLPELKDAMWYNHPPFPPLVKAEPSGNNNLITWTLAEEGSYPIQGYKIYRSRFPSKEPLTYLGMTEKTSQNFLDSNSILNVTYYYLVRSFDTEEIESIPSNFALLDRIKPRISILSPVNGFLTNQPNIILKGLALDLESGIKQVLLNNSPLSCNKNGEFEIDYRLVEKQNYIQILAEDNSGNINIEQIVVILDSIAPKLQIDFPKDQTELYALETNTRGSLYEDGSGIKSFTINKKDIIFDSTGNFIAPIDIVPGNNQFIFLVSDNAGNFTEKIITIHGVKKVTILLTINSQEIIVNEIPSMIEAPPYIEEKSGRTLIPTRFVVEPIGGKIIFIEAEQKITIQREQDRIDLWIGKNISIVNGVEKKIDEQDFSLCPRINKGRTFLPLRFVAENIGFLVEWNPLLHQIKLQFPKKDLN